jgi:hypothetical protein
MNVVFIHIGSELPEYFFDSLYQTLLINKYKCKIYVIIDESTIQTFNSRISEFSFENYMISDFNHYNIINVIPISVLDIELSNNTTFNKYIQIMNDRFQNISEFRGGFWISTTSRFFYICALMKILNIKNLFHIENDIMMYESFDNVYNNMCNYFKKESINQICMIQDAPKRVIPSLLFFPNYDSLNMLTQYITNELSFSSEFLNDMNILGSYPDRLELPLMPKDTLQMQSKIIFDGAALGQYLGGVDYKNLPNSSDPITRYNNPSRGFINETAVIKANDYYFIKSKVNLPHLRIPINIPVLYERSNEMSTPIRIANLHIHSKQLYEFSSLSDIEFNDIISGDRILSLCDFVLLTRPIYEFHKNIEKYAKDIILIRDYNNINGQLLNNYFRNHCKKQKTNVVKLFIYTHMLDEFQKFVLPILDKSIDYHLYLHNSDHAFTDKHNDILKNDHIKKIYAQNLDYSSESNKLTLLPIGIANSMWKHGDLLELYKTKSEIYREKKYKSIYVNINPNTYFYRKSVLDKIIEKGQLTIATNKPYTQYLQELAQHRFCLCIRGNGIDTHRFWESLYLGVIPVIINNKTTKSDNFVKYLRKLKIPFYEITENDLDEMFEKYTDNFFNAELYSKLNNESCIYNIQSLKLSFYK